MIHLEALPPYPKSKGVDYLVKKALKDLKTLQYGGVDGVIIENEWDHPHTLKIGKTQRAALTVITKAVVEAANIPVGLSVLLNDWETAFAVSKITGANFIRLDVFVDHAYDPNWEIEIKENPIEIINFRKQLKGEKILLMADIQVKYKKMLEKKTKAQSAIEAVGYGADMVVVTGEGKMRGPSIYDLKSVKRAIGKTPVIVGNGIGADNFKNYLPYADGFIVGYSFKSLEDGPETGGEEISLSKVKKIMSIRNNYLRKNSKIK